MNQIKSRVMSGSDVYELAGGGIHDDNLVAEDETLVAAVFRHYDDNLLRDGVQGHRAQYRDSHQHVDVDVFTTCARDDWTFVRLSPTAKSRFPSFPCG